LKKPKLINQLFGKGLKQARLNLTGPKGHYVTPEKLGKLVGVSGQTIRNYESGESEPTLAQIGKLLDETGAPYEWPPFISLVPDVEQGVSGGEDGGGTGEQLGKPKPTQPFDAKQGAKRRRKGSG
jgi:transcriptional regulator with XRE-family HTH domain